RERGPRRLHRAIDVGRGAQADRGDRLLGGGIDHVERARLDRIDPRPIDVELQVIAHPTCSSSVFRIAVDGSRYFRLTIPTGPPRHKRKPHDGASSHGRMATNFRMSSIRIEHLCKRYGAVDAVRDVSLDCPEGQLLALLGPSGCGKTSILKMLAGI